MRSLLLVVVSLTLLAAPLCGAELKVQVTDPQTTAVAGARENFDLVNKHGSEQQRSVMGENKKGEAGASPERV